MIKLMVLLLAAFPYTDAPICKDIQGCYDTYNKLYYDGKLPKADVAYGPCPIRNVQACSYKVNGMITVRLIPKYNLAPDTAHFNLLHETCHIAHWDEELESHGPIFQKCMHRLADLNAFEGLW
jgi:hypothetical protein